MSTCPYLHAAAIAACRPDQPLCSLHVIVPATEPQIGTTLQALLTQKRSTHGILLKKFLF